MPSLLNFQGPITIFNAKNEWSAPRTVTLDRNPDQGFGFSVRGDAPVRVAEMEPGSVAEVTEILHAVWKLSILFYLRYNLASLTYV
jgi:hypothetical protein